MPTTTPKRGFLKPVGGDLVSLLRSWYASALDVIDNMVDDSDVRLTNSRTPSGAAGGVLSGTYPNPGFAVDMATQAELDATTALLTADRVVVTTRAPYNARCDARWLSDVVTTSGSAVVTSASASFTAADVGKTFSLRVGSVGLTTTIASRQSATQVTLAANVAATGTGAIAVYGTDDTAAIVAARNATPRGGLLYQPGESLISAVIDFTEDITIRTPGFSEVTGGIIDSSFGSGPSRAPYLAGAGFTQVTAATNIVNMTGTGKNVHLHDLALKFAPAIMFLNTGHGVWAHPSATYTSGGHENGLFNPRWDNVCVFGHDGNHYAFSMNNSNLGTFTHLRGHGGGGLNIESDSYGAAYGNAVFEHPFFRVICGGSAYGFRLAARNMGSYPSLNLMDFYRPQCNILDPTLAPAFANLGIADTTISQYLWRNVGPAYPAFVGIYSPDLEDDGVTAFPIDFGGMYSGTVVHGNPLMSSVPINGYSTPVRSQPGQPMAPTLTPGTGLGTGGAVSLIHGDDQGGVLLVTVGTSPAGPGSVLFTVTSPSLPPTGLRTAHFRGYADGGFAGAVFYAQGIALNSKTVECRSTGTFSAGWQFQVMFDIVPFST